MGTDIVIVDDHSLILEGLKSLLSTSLEGSRVHIAQNASQLLSLTKKYQFSVFIVDITLPDMDGFDLIHIIKNKFPNAKIIVSTMHEEIWIVNKLKTSEIDAVVFKSSAGEHIVEAVRTVLEGGTYYCPGFRKIYKEKERNYCIIDEQSSIPTSRELEVLKAIAKGMSTHEISKSLFISENTVEWHRKNLMLKFGARNATDLVVKALSKGFLSIPLK